MRKTPVSTRAPRLRASLVAVAIAAISGATLTGSPASAAAPTTDTTQFKGVNWADPRDNFADDELQLSGLSTSDTYAQTYTKASRIISAFRANLGANTVRLPINPYTVNGSYWKSYRGRHRRRDGPRLQGHRVLLGGHGRPQGRLHRRRGHLLADVEHRGQGLQGQLPGLLRADERAARLHRHRVGRHRREVAGHLQVRAAQPGLRQRRRLQRPRHDRVRRPAPEGHLPVVAPLRLLEVVRHLRRVGGRPEGAHR